MMVSGMPGNWRVKRARSSSPRSMSSVTWTAVTWSDIVRPNLIAWMTSRVRSGTGTTTRWWRWGRPKVSSGRTWVSTRRRSYWRWTNSIATTRIGTMTVSYTHLRAHETDSYL